MSCPFVMSYDTKHHPLLIEGAQTQDVDKQLNRGPTRPGFEIE